MTLKELAEDLKRYVTLDRFNPVEKIVYGFAGIILTSVAVLLVSLVLRK